MPREGVVTMFSDKNSLHNRTPRRSLYCIWIRAHEGANAPLVSIWIDPEMKAFEPDIRQIRQGSGLTETITLESDACVVDEDEPKSAPQHVIGADLTIRE